MFERYESLTGDEIPGVAKEEKRRGKKIGKYVLGEHALFRPDGRYLPYISIRSLVQDKGTVHVTSCCIGCVAVDRLVIRTENGAFVFDFSSEEKAAAAKNFIESKNMKMSVDKNDCSVYSSNCR